MIVTPAVATRAETRVVVGDDGYDPEQVRSLLDGTGVTVAEAREPWSGDDVVGLLVGTETEVRSSDLDRLPALRVVAGTGAILLSFDSKEERDRAAGELIGESGLLIQGSVAGGAG